MSCQKYEDPIELDKYQDQIETNVKYISTLTDNMKSFTHKTSKLRDSGDEMVKTILDFTDIGSSTDLETKIFNQNLEQFAQCLSIIEDHRDCQIERLNTKVLNSFNQLNEFLKYTKTEFKNTTHYYNKECLKYKKLLSNRNSLCKHTNKMQPTLEIKSLQTEINNLMTKFDSERKKSIQSILRDYTLIQLSFCTQAIQIYTNAYKCLFNSNNDMIVDKNMESMTKDLYRSNFDTISRDLFHNIKSNQSLNNNNNNNNNNFNNKSLLSQSIIKFRNSFINEQNLERIEESIEESSTSTKTNETIDSCLIGNDRMITSYDRDKEIDRLFYFNETQL